MAKLSSIHGRRLRSVAVAGLIVGATGAFFPGGHAAHAMTMAPGTPPPIVGTVGASVSKDNVSNSETDATLTGGYIDVTIDSGTVRLDGTSKTATGGVSPAFGPLTPFVPAVLTDGAAASNSAGPGLSFTSTDGSGTCLTGSVNLIELTYNGVNAQGVATDSLTVDCAVAGTSPNGKRTVQLTLVTTAGGSSSSSAATPELGSGELLATGLVPALGIVLYRRRRQRRAAK